MLILIYDITTIIAIKVLFIILILMFMIVLLIVMIILMTTFKGLMKNAYCQLKRNSR